MGVQDADSAEISGVEGDLSTDRSSGGDRSLVEDGNQSRGAGIVDSPDGICRIHVLIVDAQMDPVAEPADHHLVFTRGHGDDRCLDHGSLSHMDGPVGVAPDEVEFVRVEGSTGQNLDSIRAGETGEPIDAVQEVRVGHIPGGGVQPAGIHHGVRTEGDAIPVDDVDLTVGGHDSVQERSGVAVDPVEHPPGGGHVEEVETFAGCDAERFPVDDDIR